MRSTTFLAVLTAVAVSIFLLLAVVGFVVLYSDEDYSRRVIQVIVSVVMAVDLVVSFVVITRLRRLLATYAAGQFDSAKHIAIDEAIDFCAQQRMYMMANSGARLEMSTNSPTEAYSVACFDIETLFRKHAADNILNSES